MRLEFTKTPSTTGLPVEDLSTKEQRAVKQTEHDFGNSDFNLDGPNNGRLDGAIVYLTSPDGERVELKMNKDNGGYLKIGPNSMEYEQFEHFFGSVAQGEWTLEIPAEDYPAVAPKLEFTTVDEGSAVDIMMDRGVADQLSKRPVTHDAAVQNEIDARNGTLLKNIQTTVTEENNASVAIKP